MPEIHDSNFNENFKLHYTHLLPKNYDTIKNILTKLRNDGFLDITQSYCDCPVTVQLRNIYYDAKCFMENFDI